MSYAKSDLGKIYNVNISGPLTNVDFKIGVPIEAVADDLQKLVTDQVKKNLMPFFDKTLPVIKYRVTKNVVPPVVDAIVNRLRTRQADLKKIIGTTAAPLAKQTGFYFALGGIALITALAVVQRRTR